MKRTRTLTILSIFLVIAIGIAGCGRKMSPSSSAVSDLKYGFTGNDSYSYLQESRIIQTVVFQGQEISSTVNTDMGFTTTGKGIADGSLMVEVTIDTLGMSVNSMGGVMNENISDIEGKSFMMTMDPKGKEKNLDEAESITYSVAGMTEANMKSSFVTIFPELPDTNIKIGYTWDDTDTLNVTTSTEIMEMITQSKYTVEAREKVSGYDCYKITYEFSGTRDGSSQTPQGMVITNADVSGTGHYYFAINEGIVVSDYSSVKADGSVVIPTGDNLPMYMTITAELKLR